MAANGLSGYSYTHTVLGGAAAALDEVCKHHRAHAQLSHCTILSTILSILMIVSSVSGQVRAYGALCGLISCRGIVHKCDAHLWRPQVRARPARSSRRRCGRADFPENSGGRYLPENPD